MTQIRKKFIREVKVTYDDGTHETFYPTVGEVDGQEKPSGYYVERLNWSQDSRGRVDAMLVCHEIYWVERHEATKEELERAHGVRD